MTIERAAFGPHLRNERESRGITLAAVAHTTKIQESLLAALERSDIARLPNGIFRRAFIREYAAAIGLPAEQVLAEFLRLFPEPDTFPGDSTIPNPVERTSDLRLTLAPDLRWKIASTRTRWLAAAADTCTVLLIATIAAFLSGANLWIVSGVIGLSCYAFSTVWTGCSLTSWWLNRVARFRTGPIRNHPVPLDTRDLLQIVARQSLSRRKALKSDLRLTHDVRDPAEPSVRASQG